MSGGTRRSSTDQATPMLSPRLHNPDDDLLDLESRPQMSQLRPAHVGGSTNRDYHGQSSPRSARGVNDGGTRPHRRLKSHRSVMLFERASSKWWNPQFAYPSLERQFWENSFPQMRVRFRWGLIFVIVSSLSWFLFQLGISGFASVLTFQIGCGTLILSLATIFAFTFFRDTYARFYLPTSFIVTFLVYVLSLLFFTMDPPILSSVGAFVCSIEVVLILYTIIPLPLYVCIIGGVSYSVLYEVISIQRTYAEDELPCLKLVLHFCIHLLGTHVFIITQVRERKTLLKVGESLISRRDMEFERNLKEQMILSVMPKKIADAIRQDTEFRRPSSATISRNQVFRPFQMNWMEPVSILFADIAGFTRMSRGKSAEELVDLLNDLFGRFDRLCTACGCEKISTLGDCYYCVSGCPEPRDDHAECCVEMGLAMVREIQQFDIDRGQEVSMRVGIHTGSVMNGIVGTRRFKFDVFSNDVTLANEMESSGQAGTVHISEKTAACLGDKYVLEEGEEHGKFRTYFVNRRAASDVLTGSGSHSSTMSPRTVEGGPGLVGTMQSNSGGELVDDGVPNDSSGSQPYVANGSGSVSASADLPVWCPDPIRHIDSSDTELSRPLFISASRSGGSMSAGRATTGPYVYSTMSNTTAAVVPPSHVRQYPLAQPQSQRVSASSSQNRLQQQQQQSGQVQCRQHPVPVTGSSNAATAACRSHSLRTRVISAQFQNGFTNRLMQPRKSISEGALADSVQSNERLKELIAHNSNGGGNAESLQPRSVTGESAVSANYSVGGRPIAPNVSNHLSGSGGAGGGSASGGHTIMSIFHEQSRFGGSARWNEESDGRPTQVESLATFFRVEDSRTDKRLADALAEAHRPLLLHSEALNPWTLQFKDSDIECEYRKHFQSEGRYKDKVLAPKESMLVDIFVACVIYLLIALCAFIVFAGSHVAWIVYFVLVTLLLFGYIAYLYWYWSRHRALVPHVTRWWSRHAVGSALLLMPIGAWLCNLQCSSKDRNQLTVLYLAFVYIFAHCNFSQLTNLLKSSLACLTGVILVLLVNVGDCPCHLDPIRNDSSLLNSALMSNSNDSAFVSRTDEMIRISFFRGNCIFRYEIIVIASLALCFVIFLNRQFESIFRMSFFGDVQSIEDMEQMQSMKEQADWLLANIIPDFVVSKLKSNQKYSENHDLVAVLFASIVNWNEMYEESYQGGREFLRVLNEVISDFDDLLDRQEFSQIEKIKTIGSTYMAAAGLNPERRKIALNSEDHLCQLMNFALALQDTLNSFNQDLLGFDFDMKIGFNIGPITAGVIGTTKLYYDIWGDTVNIASRMYSTGVIGKIQVNGRVKEQLDQYYDFDYRGRKDVKGVEGGMDVYLVIGKKASTKFG